MRPERAAVISLGFRMICALDILIKIFSLLPSVDQQGPSSNSSISQTPKMLKYYKVRIDYASTVEERMEPERTLSWMRLCNPHPSRPTTAASWEPSTFRTRRRPRRTRTWKGVPRWTEGYVIRSRNLPFLYNIKGERRGRENRAMRDARSAGSFLSAPFPSSIGGWRGIGRMMRERPLEEGVSWFSNLKVRWCVNKETSEWQLRKAIVLHQESDLEGL